MEFGYRAKDSALNVVEGTIEAESEAAAITKLRGLGMYPIRLAEVAEAPAVEVLPGASRRVPTATLAYATRQLGDLLGGGLSLFNALSLLSAQVEHRGLRAVVRQVADAVREGRTLSEALSQHPAIFSPLYVSMIRAGETGGGLETVLGRLTESLESESDLKSRVTSALVYPSVVLVIGCLTVLVLLTYVVPKLTTLFTETGQLLPLPTRILLAVSGVLSRGWWLLVLGAVGAGWGLRAFRRSAAGSVAWDRMILRLPLAGAVARKLQTARFTRNLGVMVGQGVPMLQALDVANATVSNSVLRQAIAGVLDAVREGGSLSRALGTSPEFPPFVSNMVAVGEESGTLEAALLKVASAYERETERALRTLTTVLEPVLIVAVGLVVMFIVMSMLLPIFELGLVAQ